MKFKFKSNRQVKPMVYSYSESFGVYDGRGREVGSSISIYEYEITEILNEPSTGVGCYTCVEIPEGSEVPKVGDSRFESYNRQTRNGKSFGGGYSSVSGFNLESVKKEIHAKFDDAKKKAIKKYAKNN
jgi:hypothetical protein